jgi:hypothetical protein
MSAVTNDQVVKDFAVSGYYWKQVKGFYTESILDDVYEKLSWHHDPLPNHDGDAEGTIAIWVLINVLFLVLTCCCGICFCTWCLGKRKRLKFDDIEKMNNVADDDGGGGGGGGGNAISKGKGSCELDSVQRKN